MSLYDDPWSQRMMFEDAGYFQDWKEPKKDDVPAPTEADRKGNNDGHIH